jgi:hypothetical protein
MSHVERIETLIKNKDVPDEKVKKEIEDLGTNTLTKAESSKVLATLQEERPDFFKQWQLEIANHYM